MSEKVPQVPISDTLENKSESFPEIHWSETHNWIGAVFCITPEPSMLVPGGMRKLRGRKIRKLRQIIEEQFFYVIYDESYVVEYIANKVLKPLGSLPYNDLQKLLSKAMTSLKSQKEHGLVKTQSYKGRSIE